ncbi:hypothetical protein BH24CHL8_BH24CHL8_07000 [soil metagenome]
MDRRGNADGMNGLDGDDQERVGTLSEIAADAAIERDSFLAQAGEQLVRFLDANRERLRDLGGLVLIDDDPDYLSIAPDGTFRSRSRYQDEETGDWVSDTEVIESAAELVELYNPADIYAAFADVAREEAGLPDEPTAADDLMDTAGISPEETVGVGIGGSDPYAGAADDWAAAQDGEVPADAETAARRLYDLALTFQERSQLSEARLIEQFEVSAADLAGVVGDMMILDDEDERLWFKADGAFEAEVVPERDEDADGEPDEGADRWQALGSPEELVMFYDPTDLFGDLAEALADAYPGVGPSEGELAGEGAAEEDVEVVEAVIVETESEVALESDRIAGTDEEPQPGR